MIIGRGYETLNLIREQRNARLKDFQNTTEGRYNKFTPTAASQLALNSRIAEQQASATTTAQTVKAQFNSFNLINAILAS